MEPLDKTHIHKQKAFQEAVDIGSIIVTKLDSNAKGGGAISAVAATGSPISYFGSGEGIFDLEYFSAKSLISRMLGIPDYEAYARTMQSIDIDVSEEVSGHISKKIFNFRDMYSQYNTIKGIGNFDALLESFGKIDTPVPQNSSEQTQKKSSMGFNSNRFNV